jgi:hypothetical protein
VWQGVPPSVRGQVWMLELSNNLQITAGKSLTSLLFVFIIIIIIIIIICFSCPSKATV